MINKKVKAFFKRNKGKILLGTGVVITGISAAAIAKLHKRSNSGIIIQFLREIPETDSFKISDIGKDLNDGWFAWLDGCKLSDCGKLGELCKIEQIDPETMITMLVLRHEKLEL